MSRVLRYAFDEALASLWRGRGSSVLSTATIALALFVLGAFLLVSANIERLRSDWSNAAEVSVYLSDDVSAEQKAAIEEIVGAGSAVRPSALVASAEFVSKEAALTRFKQTFTDLAAAADTLESNPLPASYELRLNPTAATEEAVEGLAVLMRQTPGVTDVRYDREWLDRLQSVASTISGLGLILGSILTLAAALTIANVVRLALHARRDEIEIMQLVGAPRAYVRGPFIMEGILHGGVGAVLALAGLALAFVVLRTRYLAPLAEAANLSAVGFLSLELCLTLLLGGMAVGCLGGLVAAGGRT
jgi:cell division transport system permease protein